jgi:hypothetical protein
MAATMFTGGDPNKVSKSGDTMTGPLILAGDPAVDLGAATKQYADENGGGGAVDSVNGQTGVVVLDASDVGADPTGTAASAASAALSSAQSYADSAVSTHSSDTTAVHGIADTANLVLTNDARLTNSRTPTAHASSHADGGSDEISIDGSQITGGSIAVARIPVGTTAGTVAAGDDARLTNARTPTAHAASHADGGSDEISIDASQVTTGTLATTRGGTGLGSFTSGAFVTATSTSALATTKTVPSGTVVGTTDTQTLSSKTLTSVPSITFTGDAAPSYAAGKLVYSTVDEALTFFNNEADISMQIGQEIYIRVRNDTGSTIANGAAVYISGVHASNIAQVTLARANAAATTVCAGLATHAIETGTIGYVCVLGLVHGLDTSAFTAGQIIFLSAAAAGALVNTSPAAPNYRYRIGIVTRAHASLGSIHVTPSTAALANGTANQVLGINTGGTAQEFKSVVGTTNQVDVTHTAGQIQVGISAGFTAASIGAQPVDADLTTMAGLTATTDNVIQSVGSAWASRTPAQLKATLALAKGDVGLGNVDNVQQQPIDSDLTAIAALAPTNDDIIQRKSGAWTNRTMTQLKTDLGLTNAITTRVMQIKVLDDTTTLTTGDGKVIVAVDASLNGKVISAAHAYVTTVSSSGLPTIQIRNVTTGNDVLSTRITIDASEFTSYTAAAAPVINTANDDVSTGQLLAVDIDVAGTGAKGLGVILTFS